MSSAALYEDCDFTLAKLAKVKFEQCSLVRCRFSGPLREVLFDGRGIGGRPAPQPMEDVDFSEALFDQVEFMGSDLSRVTIPADADVRLIRRYRCVVEHALSALEGNQSLTARMLRGEFENRLRMMRAGQGEEEDNVFNRRDYASLVGGKLLELAVGFRGGRGQMRVGRYRLAG